MASPLVDKSWTTRQRSPFQSESVNLRCEILITISIKTNVPERNLQSGAMATMRSSQVVVDLARLEYLPTPPTEVCSTATG